MRKVLEAAPERTAVEEQCRHHWVIESPNGPSSIGICKRCGAVTESNNYLPYSPWDEDRSTFGELSGSTRLESDNESDA